MKLAGKIAIVTGGGSGIEHQTARLFAENGATVLVADRNGEAATRVAEELAATGTRAEVMTVDRSFDHIVEHAYDCERVRVEQRPVAQLASQVLGASRSLSTGRCRGCAACQ